MDLFCAERMCQSRAFKDNVIFNDDRVLNELLDIENVYLPRCNYFDDTIQPDLEPYMRRIVTKWMLEVCEDLRCEDQVFPLAVNLFDRYLCCSETPQKFLQLLAADCILVASKIRQSLTISVETLCGYACNTITPCQIKQYEVLLVSKLNWDLSAVTAFDFIDHILHRIRWNKHQTMIRRHSFTLVHVCYTELEFLLVKPSTIAAACVVSAVRGVKISIEPDTMNFLCSITRCQPDQVETYVDAIEKIVSAETAVLMETSKTTPFAVAGDAAPTTQPFSTTAHHIDSKLYYKDDEYNEDMDDDFHDDDDDDDEVDDDDDDENYLYYHHSSDRSSSSSPSDYRRYQHVSVIGSGTSTGTETPPPTPPTLAAMYDLL